MYKENLPPWPAAGAEPRIVEEASAVPAGASPDLQPELSSNQLPGPGTESEQTLVLSHDFIISVCLCRIRQNTLIQALWQEKKSTLKYT